MNAPDAAELARAPGVRPGGECPRCGKPMLRNGVLLARVVVLGCAHSTAKCGQCKAWVRVPVMISAAGEPGCRKTPTQA